METKPSLIRDEEMAAPILNDNKKLGIDDSYGCTTCSYSVEILKIDDEENTITYKCLNPKENETEKTIPISEYLDSMRKYTYLYSECSLCHKKQNEFKDIPIFSYCIKCDKVICSNCISKHLKLNEKNHPDLNTEYIIKNNEKSVKCLLHPNKENLAFCLKCNTHICIECKRSRKHIGHKKNDIVEVLVTEEIKDILNGIINIYKERIIKLNEEKEKKGIELINKKENEKEKKEKQKKEKIKEVQKELEKELLENEKLLNDNLYQLKIKYENEVKICNNKFKILNTKIKKKYRSINDYYNRKFNEELYYLEKEYNDNVSNLEYDKKLNINKNLLLINQILKNTQENYPDNYYYNNNISNIIFKYYDSRDEDVQKVLTKDVYNELLNKEKEEQEYKNEQKELAKLKYLKNLSNEKNNINDEYKNKALISDNFNKIIINDENDNNKITMIYQKDKNKREIRVLGEEFIINNKGNCKLIINKKEFNICECLKYDEYDINKDDDDLLSIILTGINNITNAKGMFSGCNSLKSLPDISKWDTKNVTNMGYMFSGCSSLKSLPDISQWDTKNVTDISYIFSGCSSLKSLPDISQWDTKNITDMSYIFSGCNLLQLLPDISKWYTKNVWYMNGLFSGCNLFH